MHQGEGQAHSHLVPESALSMRRPDRDVDGGHRSRDQDGEDEGDDVVLASLCQKEPDGEVSATAVGVAACRRGARERRTEKYE